MMKSFSTLKQRYDGSSTTAVCGVCRDHSVLMGKLLTKMCPEIGKNTCAITYALSGNYHQMLVSQIDDTVHLINYKDRSSSRLRGLESLTPENENSTSYRLWCPDKKGNMVAAQQMPTPLGLVLNEVMGGNNSRDFDPLLFSSHNLIRQQIVSADGDSQANVFAAELPNGDLISGIAASLSYSKKAKLKAGDIVNINLIYKGNVGSAVLYKKTFQSEVVESKKDHQLLVAINLQQEIKVPVTLNLSFGKITGEISGNFHLLGGPSITVGGKKKKMHEATAVLYQEVDF